MRLEDIMNKQVETVKTTDSADSAWERMSAKRIHHLVVADNSRVVGIISERDLGGRRGSALRKNQTVKDIMTENTVTAKPTATVRQAANLLRGRAIGCLPIVDGGKIKGIVTVTDLLELLGRGAEKPTTRAERATLSRRLQKDNRPSVPRKNQSGKRR